MSFQILLKSSVRSDIKGLGKSKFGQIFGKAFQFLMTRPEDGKPLTGNFSGYYSLRVGDYRVIYIIRGETVIIARIGHRSDAYKKSIEE
ncbi:MAG: type II toxin-antitoxin system RelE/ParE family toxin [Calditrichota bacterium]